MSMLIYIYIDTMRLWVARLSTVSHSSSMSHSAQSSVFLNSRPRPGGNIFFPNVNSEQVAALFIYTKPDSAGGRICNNPVAVFRDSSDISTHFLARVDLGIIFAAITGMAIFARAENRKLHAGNVIRWKYTVCRSRPDSSRDPINPSVAVCDGMGSSAP